MKFSTVRYKTGFSKAIHYGDGDGDCIVVFYIRLADGILYPAVQISKKTRKELAKVLLDFRRARRVVGCSSSALFGGGYPIGSLRWLACHSGKIRDFSGPKIRCINFKTQRTRSILKFVDS